MQASCRGLRGKELDPKCVTSQEQVGCSFCGETYRVAVQGYDQPFLLRLVPYSQTAAAEAQALVDRLTPEATQGLVSAYLDWFRVGKAQLGILMEYVQGDRLIGEIGSPVQPLLESGLQGLALLQSLGLAHGDVKPSNIIVRDGRAVLVDLALPSYSQQCNSCLHSSIATPRYMAPEALASMIEGLPLDLQQTQAADVWSLAVSLWELAAQQIPYEVVGKANTYAAMISTPLAMPTNLAPAVSQTLSKMLTLDPAQRPSAAQLLQELGSATVIS